MVLREKLKSIKMAKGEVLISYLTRISQVRDELAAVGEVVPNAKLVRTAFEWDFKALGCVCGGFGS